MICQQTAGANGSLTNFDGRWKYYFMCRQIGGAMSQYLQCRISGSPSTFLLTMSPRNGAPSTTKDGASPTSGVTKLFLVDSELVFCRCHPASSGIRWQSLLTRNRQIVYLYLAKSNDVISFQDMTLSVNLHTEPFLLFFC